MANPLPKDVRPASPGLSACKSKPFTISSMKFIAAGIALSVSLAMPMGAHASNTAATQALDRASSAGEVSALMAEVAAAVEYSENEILSKTGVSTKINGTGYRASSKVEGTVSTSGVAFRREPKVTGGPLYHSSYWIPEAALALYSVDRGDPVEAAALRMLKKPKAKWIADTSIAYDDGNRWASILLPEFAWNWYADPDYIDSGSRTANGGTTAYKFAHRNPYFGEVKTSVTVEVDAQGRVTQVSEVGGQFSITYLFEYKSGAIKVPPASTYVNATDVSIAKEAALIPQYVANLKGAILEELAWGVSKDSIVKAVSQWVGYYAAEAAITYDWAEEATGARFWAENPVNSKITGWKLTVGKNGKLVTRKL